VKRDRPIFFGYADQFVEFTDQAIPVERRKAMTPHLPGSRDIEEWQVAVWNLPDDFVSRPQKLQFMLLQVAFNEFDPIQVVGDLLRNRSLWQGAVMTRAYSMLPDFTNLAPLFTDLVGLRDIDRVWNVDSFMSAPPAVPRSGARSSMAGLAGRQNSTTARNPATCCAAAGLLPPTSS
jgi:hypothetical protein